jgi:drug/metabolite transporter (DMT)-like permease
VGDPACLRPGGAIFALDISLGFTAIKLTTVADAAIIGALAPVLIALASARWLGERWWQDASRARLPRRRDLSRSGRRARRVEPLGDRRSPVDVRVGSYWLFSRRAPAASALEYMTSVMIGGAIAITPVALLSGGVPPALPDTHDWVLLVVFAVLPGATGHLLVAWSHGHVESWLSALITQCSPVVAAITAWLVLDEPLTALAVVGGLVVLAATGVLVATSRRREPTGELEPVA